jgi:hypothetical protein
METKARLGAKGVGRKITGENSQYELREPQFLTVLFLPLKSAV